MMKAKERMIAWLLIIYTIVLISNTSRGQEMCTVSAVRKFKLKLIGKETKSFAM